MRLTTILRSAAALIILATSVELSLAQSCAGTTPELYSWWPSDFDAMDVVGPGTGILEGDVAVTPGLIGGALTFHGSGGFVSVTNSGAFNFAPSEQFTVEAWVRPNVLWLAPTGYQALVVKCPVNGYWDWGLYMTPAGTFMAGSHLNHAVESSTVAAAGAWHHVAATYAAGSWNLYVNGALEASASSSFISQSDGVLAFGRKGNTLSWMGFIDYYDGQLDDIAIYRRALTAGEINAIYQAGSAGKCLLPVAARKTTWGRLKLHAS